MKNIKKFAILCASVLVILAVANVSFAANTIQANNITDNNTSNTGSNSLNTANNTANNAANNTLNNTANNTSNSLTQNSANQINTTNSSEDLPNTGIEDTYLNFALILLLTLVFGMFSLVQYNKIIKKDNEEN